MENIFICPYCGNIENYNKVIYIMQNNFRDYECCNCKRKLELEDSYPPLPGIDLRIIAKTQYELFKNQNKSNIREFLKFLKEKEICIFKESELVQYMQIYESIRTNYEDNNIEEYKYILDEFEEKIVCKYGSEY